MNAPPPLTSNLADSVASCGSTSRRDGSNAMWHWPVLSFLLVLFCARNCGAQVVDPVTSAQAPVPGVGHHYIGMGTETVNPADGSVNFDLPIQTPTGRGLSFPFGIHYAEAEPFFLSNNASGPSFGWTTPAANAQLSPFDLNGWSYELPNYQAQAFLANTQTESSGCSDYPNWRVAPVSAIFPNQDEGAPGPSLLGTGDIDTMQASTSTGTPDTSTTLSLACTFSEASAHTSISTGKERDTESGNDYFGA